MNNTVWIQIIVTLGSVVGGMFLTIRYSMNLAQKKEKAFLDYLKESQAQQLLYYETKNGIIEKISATFSKAIEKSADKNAKALEKLANELRGKQDNK